MLFYIFIKRPALGAPVRKGEGLEKGLQAPPPPLLQFPKDR